MFKHLLDKNTIMMWMCMVCCISEFIILSQQSDSYNLSQSKGIAVFQKRQVSGDISDDFSVQTDTRLSLRNPLKSFMLLCKRRHILWNLKKVKWVFFYCCAPETNAYNFEERITCYFGCETRQMYCCILNHKWFLHIFTNILPNYQSSYFIVLK